MFVSKNLEVNEQGHLTIAGNDAVSLAREYGTPVYVMDESLIRENCRKFRESFERYYGGAGMALYASKAFCCKEMCRIAAEGGNRAGCGLARGALYGPERRLPG